MLPKPASSRAPKSRQYFSSVSPSSPSYPYPQTPHGILTNLRARTRLTNLAVSLIILTLSLSLLLNLQHYLTPGPSIRGTARRKAQAGGWDLATTEQLESDIPLSIETTVERDPRFGRLRHMIMVPGHAIWTGHDVDRVLEDDQWVLEPMQRGGSVRTFVKHIEEAAAVLRGDDEALLVFSGGATRNPPSPPISEALSYLLLANALPVLPTSSGGQHADGSGLGSGSGATALPASLRAVTEEYAMDSYQNLLFSFARFHEVTGRWPEKVTVVGYGMKQRRFEQLHRRVIGFPADGFRYIGIDDEGDTTEHYAGELKYGYTPFLHSPPGCHPPLSTKKLLRNPYNRYHPYHTSCPDLIELFEWCPPFRELDGTVEAGEQWREVPIFPGLVPWREGVGGEGKGGTRWGRERD